MKRFLLRASSLSWPVQSLLICMAFLLVGTAIVGDYASGVDTLGQRQAAERNFAYVMGATDRLDGFAVEHDRYYGIAFELPLLLIEKSLGLEERSLGLEEDSRSLYLMRHLVTHGFFLVGGFCCSLLVYRLSNRRGVALVALLLFLLQPRLYAHSFFNSKDLPFLSMFMVTLYLTHRAFRKETVGAFLLCGVSVGILTNLRIMGLMLYPAVLALRGLDLVQAGREGRQRVLTTGAVFALAGPCTLYALSPYLWASPFEFLTALQTLAHHPTHVKLFFQGRLVQAPNLPWHYIPTWIGISTPPVTLVCSVLGVIVVGVRSIREPRMALGNTDLRVGLLLVACLTLPVVAIVVLGSHMYTTWRHTFFLHAPLCCLAGLGLQWARGGGLNRSAAVYALVGLGVLVTGREMVRLHPLQQVYFNGLVDRTTPESLRTHYTLDPWGTSCREGLIFLRRRYPDTKVHILYTTKTYTSWITLPQASRAWLVLVKKGADVQIQCGQELQSTRTWWSEPPIIGPPFEARWRVVRELPLENALYVRKVYNSTLLTVTGLMTVPERSRSVTHRVESYQDVTSNRLVQQGEFDLYSYPHGRLLGYARDECTAGDVRATFFLHIVPVEVADLPARRRQYGFDNLDFRFNAWGHRRRWQCWASVVLPDYPISRIRTGQFLRVGSNRFKQIWKVELSGQSLEPDPVSPERGNGNDETLMCEEYG